MSSNANSLSVLSGPGWLWPNAADWFYHHFIINRFIKFMLLSLVLSHATSQVTWLHPHYNEPALKVCNAEKFCGMNLKWSETVRAVEFLILSMRLTCTMRVTCLSGAKVLWTLCDGRFVEISTDFPTHLSKNRTCSLQWFDSRQNRGSCDDNLDAMTIYIWGSAETHVSVLE
jgi:hypothetical protein